MNTEQEHAAYQAWIDLHPLSYPGIEYDAFVAGYRAALQSQPKAEAYCESCQRVGMSNCSDFTHCGQPRCVTCKQLLLQSQDRDEWLKEHEALMHRVSKAAIIVGYSSEGEAKLMQAEKALMDHARRIEGDA